MSIFKDTIRVKALRTTIQELELRVAQQTRESRLVIDNTVDAKVKDIKDKNISLEKESAILQKENSMLNKAFDELGFDVKDTKEIISDLVKGLASKNTVNVIK